MEGKKEQAHFPEHAVAATCALGARQGPGVSDSPETPLTLPQPGGGTQPQAAPGGTWVSTPTLL